MTDSWPDLKPWLQGAWSQSEVPQRWLRETTRLEKLTKLKNKTECLEPSCLPNSTYSNGHALFFVLFESRQHRLLRRRLPRVLRERRRWLWDAAGRGPVDSFFLFSWGGGRSMTCTERGRCWGNEHLCNMQDCQDGKMLCGSNIGIYNGTLVNGNRLTPAVQFLVA